MWSGNTVTVKALFFNQLAVTALPIETGDIVRQSKLNIESYVNDLAKRVLGDTQPAMEQESGSLESVLRGLAIELWSDAAGDPFIVADEEDARRLGAPRGTVYTAAEMRRELQIGDPASVLEIHEWKRAFNGRVPEVQKRGPEIVPGTASTCDGGGG
jgi:hypothetical protein